MRDFTRIALLGLFVYAVIAIIAVTQTYALNITEGVIINATAANIAMIVTDNITVTQLDLGENATAGQNITMWGLDFGNADTEYAKIAVTKGNTTFNSSVFPANNASLELFDERHITGTSLINFTDVNITTTVPDCSNITSLVYTLPNTTATTHTSGWACEQDGRITLHIGAMQQPTTATLTNSFKFTYENWKIVFNIYEEETRDLFTKENMTLTLIHEDLSQILKSDTGTISVNSTPWGSYEVRYTSTSYDARTFWFMTTSENTTTIDLYLINTSLSTDVTAQVEDETSTYVENSTINVLRWYNITNDYELVEMARTDNEGKSLLRLKTNSEWYRFILSYGGTIRQSTTPKQILSSNIYFTIDLLEDYLESFQQTQSLYTLLSYNNDTYTYTYTWNDAQNYLAEACLKVERSKYSGKTTLSDECDTAVAGTLTYTFNPNVTGLYTATGYIESSSAYSKHITDTEETTIDSGARAIFGQNGLLMGFFVVGTAAAIGAWNPAVSLILTIFVLIGGAMTGIWALSISSIAGIAIIGIIILVKAKT